MCVVPQVVVLLGLLGKPAWPRTVSTGGGGRTNCHSRGLSTRRNGQYNKIYIYIYTKSNFIWSRNTSVLHNIIYKCLILVLLSHTELPLLLVFNLWCSLQESSLSNLLTLSHLCLNHFIFVIKLFLYLSTIDFII